MAHHKRKKPKQGRAGCLLCKPSKLSTNRTADRMREKRLWRLVEERGNGDGS